VFEAQEEDERVPRAAPVTSEAAIATAIETDRDRRDRRGSGGQIETETETETGGCDGVTGENTVSHSNYRISSAEGYYMES